MKPACGVIYAAPSNIRTPSAAVQKYMPAMQRNQSPRIPLDGLHRKMAAFLVTGRCRLHRILIWSTHCCRWTSVRILDDFSYGCRETSPGTSKSSSVT